MHKIAKSGYLLRYNKLCFHGFQDVITDQVLAHYSAHYHNQLSCVVHTFILVDPVVVGGLPSAGRPPEMHLHPLRVQCGALPRTVVKRITRKIKVYKNLNNFQKKTHQRIPLQQDFSDCVLGGHLCQGLGGLQPSVSWILILSITREGLTDTDLHFTLQCSLHAYICSLPCTFRLCYQKIFSVV